MQNKKKLFLNKKKMDKRQHLLKIGTGVIKGSLWLGKAPNIRIFSTGRCFTHF